MNVQRDRHSPPGGWRAIAARMRRTALPLIFGGLASGGGWVLAQEYSVSRPPVVGAMAEISAGPHKTVMSQSIIKLPIQIDERVRPQIQEVLIFVKDGPKAPWVLRERVSPTQSSYVFRAPRDGEYWFKLATVDRQGRSNVPDIQREVPDAIVVVDTQASAPAPAAPQSNSLLEVRYLGESPDGVNFQLALSSGTLDLARLKCHYQTANRQWHALEALPGRPDQFCIPAQAVLSGMIRVSAAEMNGPAVAREVNLHHLMAANQPASGGNHSVMQPPLQPLPQATVPVDSDKLILHTPPGHGEVINPSPPGDKSSAVKSANADNKVVPLNSRVEVVRPKPPVSTPVDSHLPLVDPASYRPNPGPELMLPAEKNTPAPQRKETVSTQRHLTNDPRVVLDYQLDQVGPSGVGRVEVYLTRDQGQTWHKVGEDADRKSPVEVNLPGDGIFGISLAVANGRGFGGNPPQPGDTPDWSVEVDTAKPSAEITGIRTSAPGEDGAAILIHWTAKDKNLTPTPVDLFSAPRREGPWQLIAKGLRNDGHYRWIPGRDCGQQAFIRLVVNDQAGNTAFSETVQPVPLDDMSRPRARPLGVNNTARLPASPLTVPGE